MDFIINPEDIIGQDFLFLDVQFVLGDPKGGFELYLKQHIPEAIFVDLDGVLCGSITEKTGRHPLPNPQDFISFLETEGIDPKARIIVYDNGGGGFAARLWWMLRTLGYSNVSVLNGGIDGWIKMGMPVESGNHVRPRTSTKISGLPKKWEEGLYPIVDASSLKDGIYSGKYVPIDSRNRERYLGLDKGPDIMAGRIPYSLNLPWGEHLDENKRLLPRNLLEERFKKTLTNGNVFYCGSGVTACFNVLLAEWLGFGRIPLYPGSWSEWIRSYPEMIEPSDS